MPCRPYLNRKNDPTLGCAHWRFRLFMESRCARRRIFRRWPSLSWHASRGCQPTSVDGEGSVAGASSQLTCVELFFNGRPSEHARNCLRGRTRRLYIRPLRAGPTCGSSERRGSPWLAVSAGYACKPRGSDRPNLVLWLVLRNSYGISDFWRLPIWP